MGLSNKQQAFIEHYLMCWSQSEAARRAGYSARTAAQQGHRLFKNVDISAAIQARLLELQMGADEALVRIAGHGRASLAPFLTADTLGFDLTTDRAQAELENIKRYKVKRRTTTTKNGDVIVEVEQDLELHDALAAKNLIGRHHALFTDKVQNRTYEDEIIDLLRTGKLTPAELKAELRDDELASRLIVAAGVSGLGSGSTDSKGKEETPIDSEHGGEPGTAL